MNVIMNECDNVYMLQQHLTIADTAARLNVSKKTIAKLVKRGEIPSVRVARLWRIPESGLVEYLERQRTSCVEKTKKAAVVAPPLRKVCKDYFA